MGKYLDSGGLSHLITKIKTLLAGKQDTLVSGTNIKTVNNTSLLGSGNLSINASNGLPSGGTKDQILAKANSTDYNTTWQEPYVVFSNGWNWWLDDFGAVYTDSDGDPHIGGELPVEYGGTGASTAAGARTNLGLTSTTGNIKINNSPVNGTTSYLYWARFGNVVSGYFSCKLSGAINAWSYARLGSSGSLPAPASGISMYWPIMLDGNGSTQAAFNLGSTGIPYIHMRGGSGAVGNVFHGSFCYVCADGA